MPSHMVTNILTVDCEDWYHTRISQKYLSKNKDTFCEDRICSSVSQLLDLFSEENTSATFFVLGAIAEKFPDLIIKIEKAGHRIGAHGYSHTNVFSKSPKDFEIEIEKVTKLLNSLVSVPVESFRAPNWSINTSCLWAIDLLKKYGYRYDSSLTKMIRPPETLSEKKIIEIPRSTEKFFKFNIPLGGAFLKIFPFKLMFQLMKKMNQKGLPFMVYIHPWEIDVDTPVLRTSLFDRIAQYHGIAGNLTKIKTLLGNFKFTSIEDFFNQREAKEQYLNKTYCVL